MYLFPHAAPDVPNGPMGAAEGQGRIVGATTVLFHQGDRAEDLYEVVSGVFRATRVFQDGRRQVVAFAYPGDVIGFGHGDLYRFDCDALTPAKVQITARGQIGDAIRNRPEFGERLLAMAAGEVASMHDLSVLLCRKSALERIAGFLISLATRTGKLANDQRVSLPMCRADIADHLGLTIETVSRNLTKLKLRGIIDLPGRGSFVIRDLDRLQDQVECEQVH
ncbi:CRP/FNR family transcriptional regulator, anaerobic regulatory protein/CRP/FNR family transcriptional regulator, nitrogen fixation regulation protein [Devosia lucknowensis]|uniref:CRP/FNR family transcriptional regulator, anaerobic regulatory protein/CRP/FNR family transcriptional regulator, nitrogen fixation regulation protein n=1 Tax=Devosia lucknowensis TaxID=1096929 RepID=A0A1Y6F8H9_9HYPH|nr:helix-turn-helix domain-containing protein [Devosia lucknowensis]SMQ68683.1 CRP/FNR family transcriptional regulator, anaerobic regulatory protein/CRP/FNR family transcriptional regulator, nitrogen fixation regulation protein [Devosia lucknowensis]